MTAPEIYNKLVVLDWTLYEVLVIQGNLALALRHSENQGPSRAVALNCLARLTSMLMLEGALTPQLLENMQRDEEDHGSADVAKMYWTLR